MWPPRRRSDLSVAAVREVIVMLRAVVDATFQPRSARSASRASIVDVPLASVSVLIQARSSTAGSGRVCRPARPSSAAALRNQSGMAMSLRRSGSSGSAQPKRRFARSRQARQKLGASPMPIGGSGLWL